MGERERGKGGERERERKIKGFFVSSREIQLIFHTSALPRNTNLNIICLPHLTVMSHIHSISVVRTLKRSVGVAYQFDEGGGEEASPSVELSLPPSLTDAHSTNQDYVSSLRWGKE